MSKEFSEALECLKELYNERAYTYDDKVNNKGNGWSEAIKHYDNIGRCLNTIKQALTTKSKKELAFEIIKKKKVNPELIEKISFIEYNAAAQDEYYRTLQETRMLESQYNSGASLRVDL